MIQKSPRIYTWVTPILLRNLLFAFLWNWFEIDQNMALRSQSIERLTMSRDQFFFPAFWACTQKTVFDLIFKQRGRELKKRRAAGYFWPTSRGFEMWTNTFLTVFDIPSQLSKLTLRRKRRNKIVKICANKDQMSSKRRYRHDFLCLNLMNYL